MSSGAPDWWLKGKLIELIEEIELIDEISLIDRITLIDTITSITDIGTLAAITNIVNMENLELVDKITLIESITSIGTIDEITRIVNIGDNVEGRPITSRFRTGRVFYRDTFEGYYEVLTEKWKSAGGTVSLGVDFPKDGMSCMKLVTGTALSNISAASLFIGGFEASKFGLECELQCSDGAANVSHISFVFILYDGTNYHECLIEWLGTTNKKWRYRNSGGNDVDVPDGSYDLYIESALQPLYHHIKFIVDFSTNNYGTLFCNEKEIDMSTLSMRSDTDPTAPHLWVKITITNAVATAGRTLRIDNLVLTDQEP